MTQNSKSKNEIAQSTKPLFPDGQNLTDYEGQEDWTRRRWAWEFLRRNKEFIEGCESLNSDSSKEEKRAVATKAGLIRFKDYREEFGAGREPPFVSAQIGFFSHLVEEDGKNGDRKTTLQLGQILIRFDLNPVMENMKSLDAQINSARGLLLRQFKKYSAASAMNKAKTLRPKTDHFLDALRMWDAKQSGMKNAETARMLFPMITKGKNDDEARDYFKNKFRSAKELIENKGYMAVAASEP